MRILLVPRMEEFEGRGSMTLMPVNFMRAAIRRDKNTRIDVVNQGPDGWLDKYMTKEEHDDRIRSIHLDMAGTGRSVGTRRVGYYIGAPLLNYMQPSNSKFFYDAVVSTAFPSNYMIKAYLGWGWQKATKRNVPLVSWSVWTVTFAWLEAAKHRAASLVKNEDDIMCELWGAMAGDLIAFQSEKSKKNHFDSWRKLMKPSVVDGLMKKTIMTPNGVQVSRVDRVIKEPGAPLDALWSGYWSEDGKVCAKAMLTAYAVGAVRSVTFNCLGGEVPEEIRKQECENVRFVGPMDNVTYQKWLKNFGIYISFSFGGIYPTRFGEMAAAGALPVVHSETALNFFPKDYPFYMESEGKVAETFLAAARYAATSNDWVKRICTHLDENHDGAKTMLKLYEATKKLSEEHRADMAGYYDEWVDKALEGVKEISHEDAVKRVVGFSACKDEKVLESMVPPGCLRWAILNHGYEDIGAEEPFYKLADPWR